MINKKKLKYASLSAMVTIVAIAIAVIVMLMADLLVDRFPIKWDLTREGLFTISAPTREILNDLEQDVVIYQLVSGTDTWRTVDEMLDNYRRHSSRISVRQIDPVRHPGFEQRFPSYTAPLRPDDLIFTSGGRYRVVPARNLFVQGQQGAAMFTMEQQFTSAILRVTDTRDVVLAFTTGHDEMEVPTWLISILNDEGFEVREIDLLTDDIEEDVDTIIIAAPQRDFALSGIVKLDEFINRGNANIIYLPAFVNEHFENLDGFIAEFGVTVNRDYVIETDSNMIAEQAISPFERIRITLPEVLAEDITRNVAGTRRFGTLRNRSLSLNEVRGITPVPLMRTSAQAYSKVNMDFDNRERESGDLSGPFTLASLTTIPIISPDGRNVEQSRVLVMSSNEWIAFSVMPEYANRAFLLGSLNYMNDRDVDVAVVPTLILPNRLDVTERDAEVINILIWILPILVILLGMLVFVRRRSL